MDKNIVLIIQSRMGSTRLPGKIMKKIMGKEILLHLIDRVLQSKLINKIVIATTDKDRDDVIIDAVKDYNPKVSCFRGSEENVLDRYYQAAKEQKADVVIRITSDCPLMDASVLDMIIKTYLEKPEFDYVSNIVRKRTFPRGLCTEVFSFQLLEQLWNNAVRREEREHVTWRITHFPEEFKVFNVESTVDYSKHRWTVDVPEDFELIEKIYERLYPENNFFGMNETLDLFIKEPKLFQINAHIDQKHA